MTMEAMLIKSNWEVINHVSNETPHLELAEYGRNDLKKSAVA